MEAKDRYFALWQATKLVEGGRVDMTDKSGNKFYSGKLPNGEYINLYVNKERFANDKNGVEDRKPHFQIQLPEKLAEIIRGTEDLKKADVVEPNAPQKEADDIPF